MRESVGEGTGKVAVALRPRITAMEVPREVRDRWQLQKNQDIAEIEAVGPILALATWPQLTNGLWIHFIDNDNAHNLMITGASGAEHLNRLGHLLSWQVRERRLYLWSEYVNTHDNPTDLASRGDRGDPNDQKWIWDRPGDIAALDEECPKPA